ncbi:MAG: hypothetical protein V4463_13180 [Pseudomonadota bacterium]
MRISCLMMMAVLPLALFGCASPPVVNERALLTYETSPKGATLYEGTLAIGIAPQTRSYVTRPDTKNVESPVVTAVWPSGAKATFWTVLNVGDDRVATLERPKDFANLAMDQANAEKVEAAARALSQTDKMRQDENLKANNHDCVNRKLTCYAAH